MHCTKHVQPCISPPCTPFMSCILQPFTPQMILQNHKKVLMTGGIPTLVSSLCPSLPACIAFLSLPLLLCHLPSRQGPTHCCPGRQTAAPARLDAACAGPLPASAGAQGDGAQCAAPVCGWSTRGHTRCEKQPSATEPLASLLAGALVCSRCSCSWPHSTSSQQLVWTSLLSHPCLSLAGPSGLPLPPQ